MVANREAVESQVQAPRAFHPPIPAGAGEANGPFLIYGLVGAQLSSWATVVGILMSTLEPGAAWLLIGGAWSTYAIGFGILGWIANQD